MALYRRFWHWRQIFRMKPSSFKEIAFPSGLNENGVSKHEFVRQGETQQNHELCLVHGFCQLESIDETHFVFINKENIGRASSRVILHFPLSRSDLIHQDFWSFVPETLKVYSSLSKNQIVRDVAFVRVDFMWNPVYYVIHLMIGLSHSYEKEFFHGEGVYCHESGCSRDISLKRKPSEFILPTQRCIVWICNWIICHTQGPNSYSIKRKMSVLLFSKMYVELLVINQTIHSIFIVKSTTPFQPIQIHKSGNLINLWSYKSRYSICDKTCLFNLKYDLVRDTTYLLYSPFSFSSYFGFHQSDETIRQIEGKPFRIIDVSIGDLVSIVT